jgi:putative NADPH-quinone reductase
MSQGRRALVVVAHPDPDSYAIELSRRAVAGLRSGGWEVDVVDLYADGFRAEMTTDERRLYEEIGHNAPDPQVQRSIDLVRSATALVFVYPTWWWGLPAIMKGWMERVMIPGVSFHLDENRKVKPRLTHIGQLVGITTYGSSRSAIAGINDAGRRTLARTLRLSMGRRCRRTWLGLYGIERTSPAQRQAFADRVESTMSKL